MFRHSLDIRQETLARFIVAASTIFCLSGCGFGYGPIEFSNLAGPAAKDRIGDAWPQGVNSEVVESVDYKSQASRDSYSTWYRIQLPKSSASNWAETLHQWEVERGFNSDKPIEGVKRIISRPPPLRQQTGTTPDWWSPPEIDFRATEVMIWYPNAESGVARATYSGFDESTNTLWIYRYACQHDRLWERGSLPDGEPIDFSKKK